MMECGEETSTNAVTLVTVKQKDESIQESLRKVNDTDTVVTFSPSNYRQSSNVRPDSELFRTYEKPFEELISETDYNWSQAKDYSFSHSGTIIKEEVKLEYDTENYSFDTNSGVEAVENSEVEQFINHQLWTTKEVESFEEKHSDHVERMQPINDAQENSPQCLLPTENEFYGNHSSDTTSTNSQLPGSGPKKNSRENKFLKCDLCLYKTPQRSDLKKHIEGIHLKIKKFKCEHCDFSAIWKGTMKIHMNAIHLKEKTHKCEYCDYTTTQNAYLKRHVDCVHLRLQKYKCHLCEHRTSLKASLDKHIALIHTRKGKYLKRKHKPKPLKQHQCDFCDFSTNLKKYLRSHISHVHETSRKYKCAHCEYSAPRPSTIRDHTETVHLKLKKHTCSLCDFKSSRSSNLKSHIKKVHSDNSKPDLLEVGNKSPKHK